MSAQAQGKLSLFDAPAAAAEKRSVDKFLLAVTLALVCLGLLMILSVSFGPRVQEGQPDPWEMFRWQSIYAALGLVVMVVAARLDYDLARRGALILMTGTLVALIVLLLSPNPELRGIVNGAVQPGEVAKLITIVYVAAWLASKGPKLSSITYGLFPFAVIVGLVTGLLVAQPSVSTAIMVGVTSLVMFFLAGADLLQFGMTMGIGGAVAGFVVLRDPRTLQRINDFLVDPIQNLQVWQLHEALVALGSGGLFGRGLGGGGAQYGWVPVAHSDAILAVWGEEMGLAGTLLVLGLYMLLAYRGFSIASHAPDDFGRILAAGITVWVFVQAFINMGVITHTIPLTGQPLPLISKGGSSMVVTLAGIGLLLSVSRGRPRRAGEASRRQGQEPAPRQPGREKNAIVADGRWHRGTRLSGPSRSQGAARSRPSRRAD